MNEFTSCQESMQYCIDNKYFSVAHLYKEEKSMNMHIHDCCEIYYSISGGKQFLIDNKCYSIMPGDIFVINQFESHYLTQVDKEVHERIILSIHPDFVKSISSPKTDLSKCFTRRDDKHCHKLSLSKEQQKRFIYYIDKLTTSSGYGSDLLDRATFLELMILINKAFYKNHGLQTDQEASLQYSTQVGEILSYINQNIATPMTIGELASHFFLSESYICRIFKNTTGMTINKYITARRISIAKALLADGMSVNDVCEKCGYNDYSNFVKSFTKSVGLSPKKYAQCSVL